MRAVNIRGSVKRIMMSVAPEISTVLLSIRSRRAIERQAKRLGLVDLARRIAEHEGTRVLSGPFAGMIMDIDALPAHTSPKLLGTYEGELHEHVERLIKRTPQTVINVGSAEGYYAVGLARRLSLARIEAFDADPKARAATRRNAMINDVGKRVNVSGILRKSMFQNLVENDQTLIVMDCEGAELDLLDPVCAPALATCDILVELHLDIYPSMTELIERRFESSHTIKSVDPCPARQRKPTGLTWLQPDDRVRAMDERRGANRWLVMLVRRPSISPSDGDALNAS